ncbi:hypothetical protein E2C01_034423 [Portunus trituberculatus]|uniref:Uncharacterized protein n=1 Tax=Portunus trituberculatus TaxID=210409 RepID=A0A5B7F0L1_PORTR|nr:hypothetical protein [Portunus trituberculatus]
MLQILLRSDPPLLVSGRPRPCPKKGHSVQSDVQTLLPQIPGCPIVTFPSFRTDLPSIMVGRPASVNLPIPSPPFHFRPPSSTPGCSPKRLSRFLLSPHRDTHHWPDSHPTAHTLREGPRHISRASGTLPPLPSQAYSRTIAAI